MWSGWTPLSTGTGGRRKARKSATTKKVYFFLMACQGGDVARHDWEVEEVRWFPIDEAIRQASHRTERQVLQQAAGKIKLGESGGL